MTLRILSAADVRAALPMASAIRAMRTAFGALSSGDALVPPRLHYALPETLGTGLVMPGTTVHPTRIATKLLTIVPGNARRRLPTINGLVVTFDPRTGRPDGLLDGGALTAIRTGAASGLATALLSPRSARMLGMIGSGPQAMTQVEAVAAVRNIGTVRLFSRTPSRLKAFARRLREQPWCTFDVELAKSAAAAAADADVVCTATPATRPLLGLGDVRPGVHINAVGSYTPQMRELAPGLLHEALVVVDQREAACAEAGEVIQAIDRGNLDPENLLELGELVNEAGKRRRNGDQLSIFKSVGHAVQDVAAGSAAVRRARRLGIGTDVQM